MASMQLKSVFVEESEKEGKYGDEPEFILKLSKYQHDPITFEIHKEDIDLLLVMLQRLKDR